MGEPRLLPVCPDCGGSVKYAPAEGYYHCAWCAENVDGGGSVYAPEWEEAEDE